MTSEAELEIHVGKNSPNGVINDVCPDAGQVKTMRYKVYCDESRQNASHKYRMVGGIWISSSDGWPFVNDYVLNCQNHGRRDFPEPVSFKNTPSRPDKIFMRYYQALLDTFFEYAAKRLISFRAVVVDQTYQFNDTRYHNGDYELGFYKLYYQLIVHWLQPGNQYHIRVGSRVVSKKVANLTETDRLNQLHGALNNGFLRINGYRYSEFPVVTVESRQAKDRVLIQLADLLMGAIGYQWNSEHSKPGASEGKRHLCSYIASRLGWTDLIRETGRLTKPVNIFYMVPQGNRNGAP